MENKDTTQIVISVQDPQLDAVGNFTSYLIVGSDKHGSFEIRRRYNDFFSLREGLRRKWPGCYIPPVPEKKIAGNKQDKFVEDRRRFLQYFCEKVAGIEYIYYSDMFQLLLRSKTGELDKTIQNLPRDSYEQLTVTYKSLFGEYEGKENPAELKNKANNFYIYLKKSEKELKNLKDEIKEVASAKRAFNDNLNVCNSIMMPEYEKNVFLEYVNQQQEGLLFTNNPEITEKAKELREATSVNGLDYLVDLISFELREVEAMQEAIEMREQFEQNIKKLQEKRKDDQAELSKLMSGKTTFKSIFTKGSKPEQIKVLEKSIQDAEKDAESLEILVNLVTIILGAIEIPKFKKYKQIQYYEILNKVSRQELKYLNVYGGLMKAALVANQNMKFE